MAAAVRTLKTVRPHIPLIKFPQRGKAPEVNPAVATATAPAPAASSGPSASAAGSKPIGATPRGSGIDYLDLPLKYQRKDISMEEMEYIERGGPV